MPGADLVSMMEMAVTEKLERLEAKRLGKVKNPRKSVEEADTSPGVRGISAPVKRFVWERDGAQCTFERADGRRCPERRGLEFHHDDPYGFGGDRSARMSDSCVARTIVTWRRKTTAKRRWTSTAVRPTSCVNRRFVFTLSRRSTRDGAFRFAERFAAI